MRRTRARPIPAGRIEPRRGARLRHRARRLLGRHPRPCRELARRRAARLHDLLLRRHLHDVAEALDGAEHRHRRRRRRAAAGDRLGGDDRAASSLEPLVLFPHHLHVDAAAFLGAGALHARRLRARRRSDDAERRRRRVRPAGRSSSTRCCSRRSARFPGSSATPALPTALAAVLLGAEFVRRACAPLAARRRRRQPRGQEPVRLSIVYLFALFAVRLVEAASAGWIGG